MFKRNKERSTPQKIPLMRRLLKPFRNDKGMTLVQALALAAMVIALLSYFYTGFNTNFGGWMGGINNNMESILGEFSIGGESGGSGGPGGNLPEENTDFEFPDNLEPGLYQTGSNFTVMLKSWDELEADGDVTTWTNPSSSANPVHLETYNKELVGDLVISDKYNGLYSRVFEDCTGLTSVYIPDTITNTGSYTFQGCTSLEAVRLPQTIYNLGNNTFSNCTSLKSIEVPEGVKTLNMSVFSGCTSLEKVKLPSTLTNLRSSVFRNCTNLKSVNIPEGVTSMENYVFQNCTSLETIALPESLTFIYDEMFKDCTSLKNVTMSSQLTSIRYSAFSGCSSLESISIPDTVTSMGNRVFQNCTSLENLEWPNGAKYIGLETFQGCVNLKEIRLPNTIKTIGKGVFAGCTNFKDIYFNGTALEWNSIQKSEDIVLDDGSLPIIHCTDGETCANHSTTITTDCGRKTPYITCPDCGKQIENHNICTITSNKCSICKTTYKVIETSHNPFDSKLNYSVIGTWDYSSAKSVDIIITVETYSGSDWLSITAGTDYVSGNSYNDVRTYLSTDGTLENKSGADSSVQFYSRSEVTYIYKNVELTSASVIFKSDSSSNNYYGAKVSVCPNY